MIGFAVALGAGVIFGIGLGVSQMVNPNKVLAFLDIAGDWDPSLAFVMGAALMTTIIGYRWVLRRPKPLLATRFSLPAQGSLRDGKLWLGSGLFGLGWGLAGFCPGPAIAALSLGWWEPVVFVLAMAAGSWLGYLFTAGDGGFWRPPWGTEKSPES